MLRHCALVFGKHTGKHSVLRDEKFSTTSLSSVYDEEHDANTVTVKLATDVFPVLPHSLLPATVRIEQSRFPPTVLFSEGERKGVCPKGTAIACL